MPELDNIAPESTPAWDTIANSQRYLTATPNKQRVAQDRYFDKYAMPKFEKAGVDVVTAREGFYNRVSPVYEASQEQQEVLKEQKEFYYNIMSEEQVQTIRDKGDIGAYEKWQKLDKWELAPYLNIMSLADDINVITNLAPKVKDGTANAQEKQELNDFLVDMAELQIRDTTIGGQIVEGGIKSVVFGIELIPAIATALEGGLVGFGAKQAGKKLAKEELEVLLKEGAEALAESTAKETGEKTAVGTAKKIAKKAVIPVSKKGAATMAPRVARNYAERYIGDNMVITDKGEALFTESKTSPALRAVQAAGDTYIEYWTEIVGGRLIGTALKPVKKAVSEGAGKMIPKGAKKFIDTLDKATAGMASKILAKKDRIAWDGFIEEFGEERMADVLRVTFGLDQEEGTTFDQFLGALVISPEQALVEGGIIAVGGTVGIATNKMANGLRKRNYNEDEIQQFIETTSQKEKEIVVSEMRAEELEEFDKIPEDVRKRFEEAPITEDTVRVELTPEEKAQLQLAGIEEVSENVYNVNDVAELIEDTYTKTRIQELSDKIRTGDVKDLSKEDLKEIQDLIRTSKIRRPKAPQDFLSALRDAGGLHLNTGKEVDLQEVLKDDVAFKGLLRKDGIREDSLTELVKEFTGREVDSVEAFEFLREAIDSPVYRIEDESILQEQEAIDRNLQFIAEEVGGDMQIIYEQAKLSERFLDIGFTQKASNELIKQQLQISRLKAQGKSNVALTKQSIKNLQTETIKLIESLPISKAKKSEFLRTVKNVNTEIQFRNAVNKITRKANDIVKMEVRNKYADSIKKTLNKAKPIERKGKFDYRTNKIFDDLREFNKLTQEQAYDKSLVLEKQPVEAGDDIRQRFLNMKMLGKSLGSPELFEQVYTDIKQLESMGKEALNNKEFVSKMERVADIEFLKNKMKTLKKSGFKNYNIAIGDFESLLNQIGGKEFMEKYNFIDEQSNEIVGNANALEELNGRVVEVYGLKGINSVPFKVSELQRDKGYTLEYIDESLGKIDLSRSNVISVYNHIKNPKLRERYYDTFGELQIDNMVGNLTEQDIRFANTLTEMLADYYPKVNSVYVRLFNRDLPRAESYFPAKSEYQTSEDLFNDFVHQATNPSFFKGRVEGKVIPNPRDIEAYAAVSKYIQQSEYIINMGLKHKRVSNIFKDIGVKNLIQDIYGKNTYENIMKKLEYSSLQGLHTKQNTISKAYNKLLGNYVSSKISVNISVPPKQLISAMNFGEKMPAIQFARYFVEGNANSLKTIDYMLTGIPYLRTRFKQGGSDHLQRMLEDAEHNLGPISRTVQKVGVNELSIKKLISVPQRTGDIYAWIFGGYARVKYLTSKAGGSMKEADAFKQVKEEGLRSQQSNLTSMMSDIQNDGGIYKIFTQFKNTVMQYYRQMQKATVQRGRGEISSQQYAKTMLLYGVVNPAVFGYISYFFGTQLWDLIKDEEDEEDRAIMSAFFSVASQPVNAIPIFSMLAEPLVRSAIYGKSWKPDIPIVSDLYDTLTSYGGDLEPNAFEFVVAAVELGTGIGIGNPVRYSKKLKTEETLEREKELRAEKKEDEAFD